MIAGRLRGAGRLASCAGAALLALGGLVLPCSSGVPPASAAPAPRRETTGRAAPGREKGRVPLLLLPLSGYRPGVYVPPAGARPRRMPVLVLLHGSNDRRVAECQTWGLTGPRWGWLLCPAGRPREDAPKHEDRFTYGTVERLLKEIRAGLRALARLHPGRIETRRLTLVGFSLGALLAPEVAYYSGGLFDSLVLVEGVRRFRRPLAAELSKRGIRRVAYLCGERTSCRRHARQRSWYLRWAGIAAKTFVMPGVGHDYPRRFERLAAEVLRWTRGRPPGAQGVGGAGRGASGAGRGVGGAGRGPSAAARQIAPRRAR